MISHVLVSLLGHGVTPSPLWNCAFRCCGSSLYSPGCLVFPRMAPRILPVMLVVASQTPPAAQAFASKSRFPAIQPVFREGTEGTRCNRDTLSACSDSIALSYFILFYPRPLSSPLACISSVSCASLVFAGCLLSSHHHNHHTHWAPFNSETTHQIRDLCCGSHLRRIFIYLIAHRLYRFVLHGSIKI